MQGQVAVLNLGRDLRILLERPTSDYRYPDLLEVRDPKFLEWGNLNPCLVDQERVLITKP